MAARAASVPTMPSSPTKGWQDNHTFVLERRFLGNGEMVFWSMKFEGEQLNLRFKNTDGYETELRGETVNRAYVVRRCLKRLGPSAARPAPRRGQPRRGAERPRAHLFASPRLAPQLATSAP